MDKKSKVILTIGISFAGLVLLTTLISALIPREAPDPKELGPTRKVTYMASRNFARLPEREKIKYMSKVRPSPQSMRTLSESERQAVFKNTGKVMHKQMHKMMKKKIKKFFQMSKVEQNQELDKMIAEHEKRRQEMEARRAQENSGNRQGGGPPGGGNHKAREQAMLEGTDSTSRAEMSEFFRLMHERRKQTQGK